MKSMRGTNYQIALIALSAATALLLGYFFYVELFPEYRIYQNDYIALEKFRSTYTGEAPPPFQSGVKQIVIPREDNGPPLIDRCTSCHVALQFEHFSPTKIAYDINGKPILDEEGIPVKVPNENDIWKKVDEKIALLKEAGNDSEASRFAALKVAHVDGNTYDVTRVLRMHPLIGAETRPFEYHPIDEYGCTSCHSGNGRGLTTAKAHGPVFDSDYEAEFIGEKPNFLEKDPLNDPPFSRAYNSKPGHKLLFQTNPILIGGLIEAKCVQCHKSSKEKLSELSEQASYAIEGRKSLSKAVIQGYESSVDALASLYKIESSIEKIGAAATLEAWQKRSDDYTIPEEERGVIAAQADFLRKNSRNPEVIREKIIHQLGTVALAEQLKAKLSESREPPSAIIKAFIADHIKSDGGGPLFAQANAIEMQKDLLLRVEKVEENLSRRPNGNLDTQVDRLTSTYSHGASLYISQACYACHRISGLARGGVGPELTLEGLKYPWFIKESIVWPQADLKTSTMPNYTLDHEELEALMTFLLAQTGHRKADAEIDHKRLLIAWEEGRKMPVEKAVPPAKIHDLRFAMTVFAEEGCAACHRLKGFESDVGFAIEKNGSADFGALLSEREWFKTLFPEEIAGSSIVAAIEANADIIDSRIVEGVRKGSILEEIEARNPGTLESFYSNFKFAVRAREGEAWKKRLHRLMMTYIQEYGLGRLVGPRPNWSGIYRSDEWLMEHFRNPSSHVAQSIMPVFPFDTTKFYALTHMLNKLAVTNRDAVRAIWKHRGFNPEQAYEIFCSQCHGDFLQGNGPVSDWIYPIPKNLRNADFLHNLTREKAYESIVYGVKGGPMPPWGEVAEGKLDAGKTPVINSSEAHQIVDWLFSHIPGGTVIRSSQEVPKWQYSPEDVIKELKREGNPLESGEKAEKALSPDLSALPTGDGYYASLTPPSTSSTSEISTYFEITPPPPGGGEEHGYYIKKKYYTPQNLAEGEAFFKLNCAVCHGNEGDGAGNRAVAMADAKPRMLTNLDWLDTRDDLRLLRSIKYGIAGTSMTPWGDLTSSRQRMQLVMYIRSISADTALRAHLMTALYKNFNESALDIERVRAGDSQALASLQNEIEAVRERQNVLHLQAKQDKEVMAAAVENYQKELNLVQKSRSYEAQDALLQTLIDTIIQEKAKVEEVGIALIQQDAAAAAPFLEIINLLGERIGYSGSTLAYDFSDESKKSLEDAFSRLGKNLEAKIEKFEKEQILLRGKVFSSQNKEKLQENESKISNIRQLKNMLVQLQARIPRTNETLSQIIEEYNSRRQQLAVE